MDVVVDVVDVMVVLFDVFGLEKCLVDGCENFEMESLIFRALQ